MQWSKTLVLAITGASGAQYAFKLLQLLVQNQCRVYVMVSSAAEIVAKQEMQIELPNTINAKQQFLSDYCEADSDQLIVCAKDDWFSPSASGSALIDGMIICPASGGTLSAIACGASNNLIERAADVALKERRQLIVVPRETPYSQIHLENMLKLTQMGAVVLPASPGFYHQPQTIDHLVDFVVARIVDQLKLEQHLVKRWGSD